MLKNSAIVGSMVICDEVTNVYNFDFNIYLLLTLKTPNDSDPLRFVVVKTKIASTFPPA